MKRKTGWRTAHLTALAVLGMTLVEGALATVITGGSCFPVTTASPGSCYGVAFTDSGSSQASALAYGEEGILKANSYSAAVTYGSDRPYFGTASSRASVTWYESLMIDVPGLTGKRGSTSVNFFFEYSGAFVKWPTPLSGAGGGFTIMLTTPSTTTATYRQGNFAVGAADHLAAYNDGIAVDFDNLLVDSFQFTFGQPYTVRVNLTVDTWAKRDGIATLDASHSAYWAGLGDVIYQGNVINNYTLQSASGTDYTRSFVPTAVPEPSAAWLLLISGLAALLSSPNSKGRRNIGFAARVAVLSHHPRVGNWAAGRRPQPA